MARITVHGPGDSARRVAVSRDVFRIGRALDNDLPLQGEGVADHHAELRLAGSGYLFSGSGGASLVNDAPSDGAVLRNGDELRLGSARLTFEYEEGDIVSDSLPGEQRVPIEDLAEETSTLTSSRVGGDAQRLGILYRAGREVLAAGSLQELTELVLPLVFDSVHSERGALLLRDDASGEMQPRLLQHRDGSELDEETLHVPRSIVSEVVSKRLGVLTFDALHDARFQDMASIQRSHIRSAICAPIWEGREILGVIYLDSRIEGQIFERSDLALLSAIANLIAIRLQQETLNEELARERVVRSTLQRYHSPDVVDEILARARRRGEPEMALEERDVTVLFADLRGWTPLAEAVSPARVAQFLNEYYALCTRLVFAQRGSVNEYLGDSVMAVFGAPVAHADHADRAVAAGLAILSELASRDEGLIAEFGSQVRVAINSGRAMVGNVGPADRLKYAVVGDPVNVAGRLERIGEPGAVTVGEATFRQLADQDGWEDLGELKLRGREKPVRTYRKRPTGGA